MPISAEPRPYADGTMIRPSDNNGLERLAVHIHRVAAPVREQVLDQLRTVLDALGTPANDETEGS